MACHHFWVGLMGSLPYKNLKINQAASAGLIVVDPSLAQAELEQSQAHDHDK